MGVARAPGEDFSSNLRRSNVQTFPSPNKPRTLFQVRCRNPGLGVSRFPFRFHTYETHLRAGKVSGKLALHRTWGSVNTNLPSFTRPHTAALPLLLRQL